MLRIQTLALIVLATMGNFPLPAPCQQGLSVSYTIRNDTNVRIILVTEYKGKKYENEFAIGQILSVSLDHPAQRKVYVAVPPSADKIEAGVVYFDKLRDKFPDGILSVTAILNEEKRQGGTVLIPKSAKLEVVKNGERLPLPDDAFEPPPEKKK